MDPRTQQIADAVRRLRKESELTQLQLAAHLDISQGRLSELERGDGSFSAEQLLTMLSIFEVTVEELMGSPKEAVAAPPTVADPMQAIVEAIEAWTTPAILAVAPRLIREIDQLRMRELQAAVFPDEHRLNWLVQNLRVAIEGDERHRRADEWLAEFQRTAREPRIVIGRIDEVDGPLGPSARNRQWARSTRISKAWCVSSMLTPADFAKALGREL